MPVYTFHSHSLLIKCFFLCYRSQELKNCCFRVAQKMPVNLVSRKDLDVLKSLSWLNRSFLKGIQICSNTIAQQLTVIIHEIKTYLLFIYLSVMIKLINDWFMTRWFLNSPPKRQRNNQSKNISWIQCRLVWSVHQQQFKFPLLQ